jgi:hypothetical protein
MPYLNKKKPDKIQKYLKESTIPFNDLRRLIDGYIARTKRIDNSLVSKASFRIRRWLYSKDKIEAYKNNLAHKRMNEFIRLLKHEERNYKRISAKNNKR